MTKIVPQDAHKPKTIKKFEHYMKNREEELARQNAKYPQVKQKKAKKRAKAIKFIAEAHEREELCFECGKDECYIDHIKEDGRQEREIIPASQLFDYVIYLHEQGATTMIRETYQLLCNRCNGIKGHDHKRKLKGVSS